MLATRLRNQRLDRTPFRRPDEVVQWLGAVQAQDYTGATWAIALRARSLTAAAIDRAFDDGRILRTHVLRPTWHFVTPADLRWMLALTGPRVRRVLASYDRTLEIDARLLGRARRIVERALEGGRHQTREALAGALRTEGRIEAKGQRLAHIVMHLEQAAVICSGPRLGRQFTYALVGERVPPAPLPSRDDALAELARRYFQSHGPATVHDFAWWSGLTVADARRGAATVDAGLRLEAPPAAERVGGAHFLLPNYDEYLIAYRHRGAVLDPRRSRNFGVFTSAEYPHQVVLDGRIAGSWQRTIGTREATVRLKLFARPSREHRTALAGQAARYGRVLGVPCRLET
ncbi:MAG: winged helix DNA-binding domain-containing protein [Vicinamibacterales bacterium]